MPGALLSSARHKSAAVRGKVAAFAETVMEKATPLTFKGASGRELLERCFTTCVQFLDEGSMVGGSARQRKQAPP